MHEEPACEIAVHSIAAQPLHEAIELFLVDPACNREIDELLLDAQVSERIVWNSHLPQSRQHAIWEDGRWYRGAKSLSPFARLVLRPSLQSLDIPQDRPRLVWKQGWPAHKLAPDAQHPLIFGPAMLRYVRWDRDGRIASATKGYQTFHCILAPGVGGQKQP